MNRRDFFRIALGGLLLAGGLDTLNKKERSSVDSLVNNSHYLVEGDVSQCYDHYVATRSLRDRRLLAYDKNIIELLKKCKEMGYDDPVTFYNSDPKRGFCY